MNRSAIERFVKLLRKHEIALVFADTAGKWPYMEDVTADFIYARLHGDEELYVSGYTEAALDWWAKRLDAWRCGNEPEDAKKVVNKPSHLRGGRDVYVYFDNDVKVRAPFDAMNLAAKLAGKSTCEPPESLKNHPGVARTSWPGFGQARPSGRGQSGGPRPEGRGLA